jgi:hypothetical protein
LNQVIDVPPLPLPSSLPERHCVGHPAERHDVHRRAARDDRGMLKTIQVLSSSAKVVTNSPGAFLVERQPGAVL